MRWLIVSELAIWGPLEPGDQRETTILSWDRDRRPTRVLYPGDLEVETTYSTTPLAAGQVRRIVGDGDSEGTSPFVTTFAYANEVAPSGVPGELAGIQRNRVTTTFRSFGGAPIEESTDHLDGAFISTIIARRLDDRLLPSQQFVTIDGVSTATSFAHDGDGLLTCAALGSICASAGSGDRHDILIDGDGLPYRANSGVFAEEFEFTGYAELDATTVYVGRTYDTSGAISDEGTLLLQQGYNTRDMLGRITEKSTTYGSDTKTVGYAYDVQGRLWKVTEDDIATVYVYDERGNRLCEKAYSTDAAPTEPLSANDCATPWLYDDQDQLQTTATGGYLYTDRGTLWRKDEGDDTTTYTYDLQGGLTSVELATTENAVTTTKVIDYVLDGTGRRIAKVVDDQLDTQYVWDGQLRVAASIDATGNVSRYVYGGGLTTPTLVHRGDKTYRVFTDHLGSPILIANTTDDADILLRAEYGPWGEVTSVSIDTDGDGVGDSTNVADWPIAQGFAGGLFEPATGLVRFGARDYDPSIGRWTAKDPILFGGGQGNLYAYVNADPVNFRDPEGTWLLQVAGVVVGGGAQAIANYDAWNGGRISLGEYAGSIAFGAGTGLVASFAPGIVGGMLAGGFGSGLNESFNQAIGAKCRNDEAISDAFVAGAITGGLGGLGAKVGSVVLRGPTLNTSVPVWLWGGFSASGGAVNYSGVGGVLGTAVGTLATD